MPIATTCPHCGKSYNLSDSLAGKQARCKDCKNVFLIPGARVQATAAASAAATAPIPPAPAPAPIPPARAKPTERTAGGVPVYRHPGHNAAPPPPAGTAPAATPYMDQIAHHIERTIGVSPMIFHEIVSEGIKLDLFIVPPTGQPPSEEHPLGTSHFTVITAGLSARPQAVPEEARPDISPLQELMIALPGDWPGMNPDGTFDKNVINDDKHWWPFAFLKMVVRMPAEYETFLAPGVTIPNGEEAAPFADNTKLGCMIAFPPILSPAAAQLQIDDQTRIDFYALWPIYAEEMQLKLDKGLEPLLKKMMDAEISELIQIDRANLCKKKGWFGR
jgi:predicted Zn finger-like uncharacterized protein